MKIPEKIEIQIIDKIGNPNRVADILFVFKIFEDAENYYNSSYFKSDKSGMIILSQQEIIKNCELKWESNIDNFSPSKFELSVLDSITTAELRNISKNYIDKIANETQIEKFLIDNGFSESNIQQAKKVIENTAKQQVENYNLLKTAKNDAVEIVTEKIEDEWIDDSIRIYKFIIV